MKEKKEVIQDRKVCRPEGYVCVLVCADLKKEDHVKKPLV